MLGFVIAAAAGFLTPQLEDMIGDPIMKTLHGHIKIEAGEKRLVTFMALLLAVAVLASFAGSGSPFLLILGAVLGYFGTRLVDAGKKQFSDSNSE